MPTTLIGIVDASVGVKTGVNFRTGKNKIGTYFAASRSVLDTTFLATLDARHVSNGLAEILKIALIKDERLFDLLEAHGSTVLRSRFQSGTPPVEREVLERAIGGMLDELRPNLWEHVLERVVDYGTRSAPPRSRCARCPSSCTARRSRSTWRSPRASRCTVGS